MVFIFKSSSSATRAAASVFVLIIIIVALYSMIVESKTIRERMTGWDVATNSYNDDDCTSEWDKLVGAVSAYNSNSPQSPQRPIYDSCIKRIANYTLVCPDETIYVHGCDGITYKNACTAERNGIYNYSTGNGVATN
jgi:hypothetical protein